MARIYISSTFVDLMEERRAARDAVLRLEHLPVAMETYTATERRPVEQCLKDVASCDAYVGIFAWRYGQVPRPHGKSITHLEYEEAGRRDLPRLIFLLRDDAPWPGKWFDPDPTRIRSLREHLLAEHNLRHFRDASELAAEVTAALSRQFGAAAPIPDLLPYLSDRREQERALEEALARVDREDPARPLVALVHGDEKQCHDKFLDRLKEVSLPRLLGLGNERTVESRFLPWPRCFRDRRELGDQLLKGLAERLLGRRTAAAGEINERLRPGPMVVHTHVLTRDWREHGIETLHGFLDLWQGWPELASDQRLLAFLFFKYEPETEDRGFLTRTLRGLRRARPPDLNEAIAGAIEACDFSAFDRLEGVVLPRLAGIERPDVEDWAREAASELGRSSEDLVREARDLFRRRRTPTLPMEELARELRGILHKVNFPSHLSVERAP